MLKGDGNRTSPFRRDRHPPAGGGMPQHDLDGLLEILNRIDLFCKKHGKPSPDEPEKFARLGTLRVLPFSRNSIDELLDD